MNLTPRSLLLACVALAVICLAVVTAFRSGSSETQPLLSEVNPSTIQDGDADGVGSQHYPVHIHAPEGPPQILTGDTDAFGNAVSMSCSTCHSIREPGRGVRDASDLDEFHQGLTFQHGTLSCLSCHNPDNYDELRLADETTVPYTFVMTLCGQCHGPQLRDYKNGAHGGMTGYWDLTRGPRFRNNCINCHDPHAPAYPRMKPTFKPIDRFLTGLSKGDGHE